ncbi:MAG: zf-HC2 domain-containing protein [Bryobacterales bacterium]|nr:zf-HC2 domain-containing protein [Bryobacterales bacterium]
MKGSNQQPPRPILPEAGVHPSREDLMALLDGELPSGRVDEVSNHLERCAGCRSVFARYESLRASFSSEKLFPGVEPLTPEHVAPTVHPVIRHFPSTVPAGGRLPSTIAASIALLAGGLLFWQLVLAPPGVSAREVIERAKVEEQRPVVHGASLRVERTLRATRRVAGVMEKQFDFQESRPLSGSLPVMIELNPIVREIAASIPSADCARLDPLSVGMMDCLSKESNAALRVLNQPKDGEGGVYQVTIENLRPHDGNPFTSVWTLRLSDWRLTRVDFRFFHVPEDIEYGLEELAYRVVEAPLITTKLELARIPVPTQPETLMDPRAEMERLIRNKADLFLALHALVLSPEDEVDIRFETDNPIQVRVLVTEESRKQEFIETLAALDGVSATVLSYADAMDYAHAQLDEGHWPGAAQKAKPSAGAMRSEGPLLFDWVANHFGGGEHGRQAALSLGTSVLDQTHALQFRVRWLARLRAAFPAEQYTLLPEELSRQLASMETSLLAELSTRHELLQQQVRAVVCPGLCDSVPALSFSSDPTPPTTGGIPSQSEESANLVHSMESEFALLKVLFVDRGFAADSRAHSAEDSQVPPHQEVQAWLDASAQVAGSLKDSRPSSLSPEWTSAR